MTNLIEQAYKQQQKYWSRFLCAFLLLVVLLVVRHLFGTVFRQHELNSHPVGIALLIVSVVLLAVMIFLLIKLGRLKARAESNPQLREALINDELARLDIAQSWKAGFIGAAITPFVFLLISSFHQINDPLLIAFATPIIGSAAFLVSYYLKSNR